MRCILLTAQNSIGVPAVSNSRKLVIAGGCGCLIGSVPYAWGRYHAAKIIVPVSGQVMLDGKPLPDTYVQFAPIPRPGQNPLDTNPGSHAFTDSEGCFTLFQIENDQPGVIVGDHKILMRSGMPGPGPDGYVNERVPFSWRKGLRSYHVSWTGSQQPVFSIKTVDKSSPKSARPSNASQD
jgi:hypothetical protein